jgi:hypothetical protein
LDERKDFMDTLSYSKEQIEKLLNIINTFPCTGFQNASKLMKIYNILNSSIKSKAGKVEEFETEKI